MTTRGLTEKDVNQLIELNDLIKSCEKASKLKDKYLNEYVDILDSLKSDWKHISNKDYPMVEAYGKSMDFKTFLRNERISIKKEEVVFKSESLNDLINNKTKDTKLISSVFDRNYATDIPDPYRKRRKNGG